MVKFIKSLSIIFLFSLLPFTGSANVTLPHLISNGMVLQRNTKLEIWGWANPGEKVIVKFRGDRYKTVTRADRKWEVTLPPMHAGGPYDMVVKGHNTIVIKDILIGEVWLCSGQSNMEVNMYRVSPLYPNIIKHPNNKNIHYFAVPETYNFQAPQDRLGSGKWITPTPENILGISAVSYFYATALYDSLHVPIGIIKSALGGSPIQSWLSLKTLKRFPPYYREALRFQNKNYVDSIKQSDETRIGNWYRELRKKDLGYKTPGKYWYNPDLNTSNWPTMLIPGYWANNTPLGMVNGAIWFRKVVDVPASMTGKPGKLLMGRIINADSDFINGVFVGSTGYQYPPRRYKIPANLLKPGKNVVVVRIISTGGQGGFVCDKPHEIMVGNQTINLDGPWKYKLGTRMPPLRSQTFIRWKPSGLYNAMIAPLENYRIKGVVWYQGESNAGYPYNYASLLENLITSWRGSWHEGNFPFLIVQLPNYMKTVPEPSESNWALLREAQMEASRNEPNTGMAVTIDLGDWNDIHPWDKKDVGNRLGWVAQKIAYGDTNIKNLSPLYKSMKVEGNKIVITFIQVGNGLVVKGGGALMQFAIAGKDRHFIWAKAQIVGKNQVVVSNKQVPHPVAVRYAWANNPNGANLYTKEGLPAAPFRTDHWTR